MVADCKAVVAACKDSPSVAGCTVAPAAGCTAVLAWEAAPVGKVAPACKAVVVAYKDCPSVADCMVVPAEDYTAAHAAAGCMAVPVAEDCKLARVDTAAAGMAAETAAAEVELEVEASAAALACQVIPSVQGA